MPGDERLYLDKKNNKLVRTGAGNAWTSVDVPAYEFTHLVPHGDAALLIGPRRRVARAIWHRAVAADHRRARAADGSHVLLEW